MSGPKPPGWEPEESDSASELHDEPHSDSEPDDELEPTDEHDGELHSDPELEPLGDSGAIAAADRTGETDAYSRAYSAPESEHFISGPYVPADLGLTAGTEFGLLVHPREGDLIRTLGEFPAAAPRHCSSCTPTLPPRPHPPAPPAGFSSGRSWSYPC